MRQRLNISASSQEGRGQRKEPPTLSWFQRAKQNQQQYLTKVENRALMLSGMRNRNSGFIKRG